MKSPKLNVHKVQMAYFFGEKSEIRTFKLINSLYSQFQEIFHTDPQSLPVPEDAPPDVPRCIWDDVNNSLTFNKVRLDYSFNIPSKSNWEELLPDFNEKIALAINNHPGITIDRVGLVAEAMSMDNLHNLLEECIRIDKFTKAKEANISWLEQIELYNVWTYITINESEALNKIVFDVNSIPGYRLQEKGITGKNAINKCSELLKGKITNVF